MTNYTVTQSKPTQQGSLEREATFIVDGYEYFEQAIEYLATLGIIISIFSPRTFASDIRLDLEAITWSITVEDKNGSWQFFHVYDTDLLYKTIQ